MVDNLPTAAYESPKDALDSADDRDSGLVKMWLDAIEARTKVEKDWRVEADDIVKIYRSQEVSGDGLAYAVVKQTAFNILYANTETLLPAIYNSPPIPDIRRRYGDPGKEGKAVAQILERALTYSLDRYDFDAEIKATLYDAVLPGRGVGRVRYIPVVGGADDGGSKDDAGEGEGGLETPAQESDEHADNVRPPEKGERIVSQDVRFEYVHYKNFRHGPGLVWSDVPWIAFEHFMAKDQIEEIAEGVDCDLVPLNWDADGNKRDQEAKQPDGDIFKRARVWEIWDKQSRKVHWICADYPDKALASVDDPLQLEDFFPVPRPIMPVDATGEMTPVPLYKSYRELAEELNEVTDRIRRLTRMMKVKGWYGTAAEDLMRLETADDGELIGAQALDVFAAAGGDLNKVIGWWPIEMIAKAVAELKDRRAEILDNIYQVSGLADIMRGQSQASETATAQNIKTQWGSLRIQRLQQDIARYIRDVFRIKSELIANHFDFGFLLKMTNVKVVPQAELAMIQQRLQAMQQQAQMAAQQGMQVQPPQVPEELQDMLDAPTVEAVEPLLRDDLMRSFKVDVETDSTIRADLTKNQQVMAEFVQGTAAFIQAAGPAVQVGLLPANVAVDIYTAFARNFKLGKQVEDSLDKLAENANKAAQQPQPPKQDPEMEKAKAEIQIEQQKMQMEQQKAQQDAALQQQKIQAEIELKRMEMQMKLQLQQEEHQMKMQITQQQAQTEQAMMQERQQRELAMADEKHSSEMARADEQHAIGLTQKDEMHSTSMRQADEQHRTKVQMEREAGDIRTKEWQAKQEKVKPTTRSVKFKRGKDGRIAEAELG